ncbi:MAG TPA: hypothetical protein VKB78_06275, partial [Pirellulales bacterium]|nr:hypothetical protein [Pirellulales bacterium]
MTSLASPLPEVRTQPDNLMPLKLAIAITLAALADWLFYLQRVGLSMALFAVVLFAATWLGNMIALDRRRLLTAIGVLVTGLIPAVEDLNPFSFLFLVAGLGFGVSILTNPDLKRLFLDRFGAFRDLFLIGPFRLIGDVVRMLTAWDFTGGFAMWFVPITFGAIFVVLFAAANPLIEHWIGLLDLNELLLHVDLSRTLFWAFVLSMVWPFVHVRWRRRKERSLAAPRPVADNAE